MAHAAAAVAISSAGGAHSIQDSLAQRMQRALMTWQHPSASMPAAAIAALAASKQGAEALEQRRSAWREAFRSLYMAVQAGACHAFYFYDSSGACSLHGLSHLILDMHWMEAVFLCELVLDHAKLLEPLRLGVRLTSAERVLRRTPRSPSWPTLARRVHWGGCACTPG